MCSRKKFLFLGFVRHKKKKVEKLGMTYLEITKLKPVLSHEKENNSESSISAKVLEGCMISLKIKIAIMDWIISYIFFYILLGAR